MRCSICNNETTWSNFFSDSGIEYWLCENCSAEHEERLLHDLPSEKFKCDCCENVFDIKDQAKSFGDGILCNHCHNELQATAQEEFIEDFDKAQKNKALEKIMDKILETTTIDKSDLIEGIHKYCYVCEKTKKLNELKYYNVDLGICGCEMQVAICDDCRNIKCNWCYTQLTSWDKAAWSNQVEGYICLSCKQKFKKL